MRVAFVSMHTHHTRDTPAIRRRTRLIRLLNQTEHAVVVLCSRWWDGDHPTFEHEGITYRAVDGECSPNHFIAKLPLALRRADPDVVHIPNTPARHARAANPVCRMLRIPMVVDWWAVGDDDAAGDCRRVASNADRIVAPSQTVETVVREYGGSEASISVIPEGIDFSLIESAPVNTEFDLVYSRHLDEHANVETFLLALAELRDREWSAAIIGNGAAAADIERTARDLRIRDRVSFLGELDDEQRVAVLKGAHVFAQTAEREPFATNLLWGLACGCVGIAEYQTDSAAHELIEQKSRLPDTRGELVSTPQEFADEIVAAGSLEHRTIDPAYERYDDSKILDRYLTCYRQAIDNYGLF
ncbi:glycosyltransferase [Halonotius roseus]|uniref:Glycosyltransferase n=1 Tax=Halonotius roseus TaxID=2511997 RepID=A0A544QQE4_9EURY|nr:glycosyltransferase [Halonotius roseus]TQQ81662.1 glycosyltransferase [Halonotius roseus]